MKELKLNTGLIDHIFSGCYGTIWEDGENGEWIELFKLKDIKNGYNNYRNEILKELQQVIPNIKDIRFTGTYNPREYNFDNDQLDFTLIVKNNFEKELVKMLENDQNFNKYLHDNYTSYDGFISLTPNNIQDWEEAILDENDVEHDQAISAAINYLLSIRYKNDYYDIEMTMYENLSGNGYITIQCSNCKSENLQWKETKDFTGYICQDCKEKMKEY